MQNTGRFAWRLVKISGVLRLHQAHAQQLRTTPSFFTSTWTSIRQKLLHDSFLLLISPTKSHIVMFMSVDVFWKKGLSTPKGEGRACECTNSVYKAAPQRARVVLARISHCKTMACYLVWLAIMIYSPFSGDCSRNIKATYTYLSNIWFCTRQLSASFIPTSRPSFIYTEWSLT